MRRYPIFIQDEENACGAYCIQSLLHYYHQKEEVYTIKEKCQMDQDGITIYGMIQCLKFYHIDAKAYHCDFKTLLKQSFPMILHTFTQDHRSHYIILYGLRKKCYIVGDPSEGLIYLSEAELCYRYSGICLLIQGVGKAEEIHYFSLGDYIIELFKKRPLFWIKMVLLTVLLGLMHFLNSLLYKEALLFLTKDPSYSQWFIVFLVMMIFVIGKNSLNYAFEVWQMRMDQLWYKENSHQLFHALWHRKEYPLIKDVGTVSLKIQDGQQFPLDMIQVISHTLLQTLLIVGTWGILYYFYPLLACFYMVLMGLFFYVLRYHQLSMEHWVKYIFYFLSKQHQIYLDVFQHQMQIQQFHFVKKMTSYFEKWTDLYLSHLTTYKKRHIAYRQWSEILFEIFLGCFLFMGGLYVLKEKLMLSDLIFIYMILSGQLSQMSQWMTLMQHLDELPVKFERYKALEHQSKEIGKHLEEPIHSIVFDHVSFGYGYRLPVLKQCTLSIHGPLWIKGDNGSGKSTLMSLLIHPHRPYQGKIYLNQQDITLYSKSSLLEHILYIDEESYLLEGTLKENILLEQNKEEQLHTLLKQFDLVDLEQRLEEEIHGQGALSLGQRQIIILLRAMLQDKDVLILDEAMSHIEEKLAKKFLKEILKQYQNKIVILIIHQTKIVNKQWRYVIMEDGKIIENEG